ncbi:MAG: copper chaperone PCu(A)C [Pseudomonas sp.]|uniref:copper chaperone PCu(A)C n=1 Tax=Pseudomonas sp. TaxID=306 RepID=UPI00339A28B7
MTHLTKSLLFAFCLVPSLLAQAHEYSQGDLHIAHPWSREMPPTAPTAAAYFVVHNQGASADRLLGADTPVAGKAQLHQHLNRDGLMKMEHVAAVDVPAGGEAVFAPMGYHVMLFDLKQPLRDGTRFALTLHFEKAGDVQVEVAVQKEAPAEQAQVHQH